MMSVRQAGAIIAQELRFDEVPEEVLNAFRVANDWRNLHAYPMKSLRLSVMACMRKNDIVGTTSARLKRMPAIRGKLKRGKVTLCAGAGKKGVGVLLRASHAPTVPPS